MSRTDHQETRSEAVAVFDDAKLIALIDREIEQPTHAQHSEYFDNDHVAFVLMNALKAEGACK